MAVPHAINIRLPSEMTCRICLEECDEKLQCLCVGYAHRACQERWINVSGRHDCEVCLAPFHDQVVYEWRCSAGEQGFGIGPSGDLPLVAISMCGLSGVYGMLLLLMRDWTLVVGFSVIVQLILLCMFMPARDEIRIENIAFLWKTCSFLVLLCMYVVGFDTPLVLDAAQMSRRTFLVWADAILLCATGVVRSCCGVVRGMRRRVLPRGDISQP